MKIHVLNHCIELWQKYNAVHNALETLNTKREVLGEQLRLRKFDIDQHLVNTLRREGHHARMFHHLPNRVRQHRRPSDETRHER